MTQTSDENKHIIEEYRKLYHKLRVLGKNFYLFFF
jgi:hypothetical protein